ncbi:MAG: MBL fold metallo-hydrolase [Longimicrobiaceae bacterium]
MKVTVLGSGSGGNATLVESGAARVLVDAGFSGRDLERRLAEVEVAPESITALVVTHDHRDHTLGAGVLARRWGLQVLLTRRTLRACRALFKGGEKVACYCCC